MTLPLRFELMNKKSIDLKLETEICTWDCSSIPVRVVKIIYIENLNNS